MNETHDFEIELAGAATNYTETVLRIADKHGVNRTVAMHVTAKSLLQMAIAFNFDNYQFKEETNNE